MSVRSDVSAKVPFSIMVVARRVYLSEGHWKALFGDVGRIGAYALPDKTLVTGHMVRVRGPSGEIRVRVMHDVVKQTSVQLSLKDHLAIDSGARIRLNTEIEDSEGCSLVGPEGTVVLADGLVNVSRRLEVDAAKASALGLRDQEVVRVLVASEKPRELPEVLVMVRPGPPFFCIDVHEAVSLEINGDSRAFVVESSAH